MIQTTKPNLFYFKESPLAEPATDGGKRKIDLRTLDGNLHPIWTCQNFKWAYRNPFSTILQRGNDYVTEQWSEDFFTGTKQDVGLALEAIANVGRCLKKCHFADAGKHFLNAAAIAVLLGIHIEIANFFKGVIGMVISSGKIVQHSIVSVVCLLASIVSLCLCKPELAKKFFLEALSNFGFIFKDIVSIVSCLGHSIPSWLPLAVMFICPPAGIALAILKIASNFTGIFDVMAYGGTAILLYTKAKFAQWDLSKDGGNEEAKKAVAEWSKLKKELNPLKSLEGAMLALYGLNVLLEGATTVIDVLAPGAGTLAKYATYGALGITAAGLGSAVYLNKHKKEHEGGIELEMTATQIGPPVLKPPQPYRLWNTG